MFGFPDPILQGWMQKGVLVAIVPGTFFNPFYRFQSLKNPYLFRCCDGTLLDGKFTGLSAVVFRSIHGLHRAGPTHPSCDASWLHLDLVSRRKEPLTLLINPLNLGQLVNHGHSKRGQVPNVAYQEFTFHCPDVLSPGMMSLVPNLHYKGLEVPSSQGLKGVALVATKTIHPGEEVMSTYFTLVDD